MGGAGATQIMKPPKVTLPSDIQLSLLAIRSLNGLELQCFAGPTHFLVPPDSQPLTAVSVSPSSQGRQYPSGLRSSRIG